MKRAGSWLVVALLAAALGWLTWKRLNPPPPVVMAKPAPAPEPVGLGGANERKTIDFSSGKPVVKDSAADKAAIDAALKDMAEATQSVTFDRPRKPAEPAPVPPKK